MSNLASVVRDVVPQVDRGPEADGSSRVIAHTALVSALLASGVVLAVLLWSYAPILHWLVRSWSRDPDYSHGYLVPVFAAALIWLRRDRQTLGGDSPSPAALGVGAALIIAAGLLRIAGIYIQIVTLEAFSLLPGLAGIALCCVGWPAIRIVWPAVAFLAFMIPLPSGIAGLLSTQLQHVATLASTFVLQLCGLPAVSEGNVIWLTDRQIGIAEACSGLRMLVSFTALACGSCLLSRRPLWEKAVVLASVPLLAIIANVVRVTATGMAFEFGSAEFAERIFHDLAGWLMMPLGLGLLLAELSLLSRLFLTPDRRVTFRTTGSGSHRLQRDNSLQGDIRRDAPRQRHSPRRRERAR